MKKDKFLTEEELKEFLSFCDEFKISQRNICDICFENASTVSQAINNKRFKRTNAKLVRYEVLEELNKKFISIKNI